MTEDIWKRYEKVSPIGFGTYGKVYKVKNKATGQYYALKEIIKSKFEVLEAQIPNIEAINEIQTENNISIEEIINYKEYLYIIMDLCESNLDEYIKMNKPISINDIKLILTQLNNTFKLMNIKKKVFKDLKLSNILIYIDRLDKCLIKLSHYGLNDFIRNSNKNSVILDDNLLTIAPEILENKNNYSDKSDIWSLGTIIYYMLFKEYPYNGKNEIQVLQDINSNKILKICSNEKLNDLLNKMLKIDVNERISWDNYFNHPFFNQDTFGFNCIKHSKIINNYCKQCKKNICEDCLIEHSNHEFIPFNKIGLNENEINRMENIFKEIDNKLNSLNRIKKDIEYLLIKMKSIKGNELIYNDDIDNNYKEYYLKSLENINKIFENDEIKLIDLNPNQIICTYDIKKDKYDKDDYLNQPIRILNCYDEAKKNGWYLEKFENNEKEIKDNCELYINDNKIDFCYKFKFPSEGKYTIKIIFKKPITNTNCMFMDCNTLSSIDLSNFNTSRVNNMSNMFYNCFSLNNLNLSNFTNNNDINMSNMFYNCFSLNNLNLSNVTNNNIINMSYMFYNCFSLNTLDLSNFHTSDVIKMKNIFNGLKRGCEIKSNDKNIKEEINYFV